jgi:hypothetical protein
MCFPVPPTPRRFSIIPVPFFPNPRRWKLRKIFYTSKEKGQLFQVTQLLPTYQKIYDNFLDGSAAAIAPLTPCNFL